MEKQLHINYNGMVLSPDLMNPVRNEMFVKARGGLWTSTYNRSYGSDWVQWCLGENFRVPTNERWTGYIITPSPNAKVLTIDNYEDLEKAYEKYPYRSGEKRLDLILRFLDYEKIAEEYDAFHVTKSGQWSTRMTIPLSLYGMDCECTHWFRWVFDDLQLIENIRFERGS